MKTRLLEFLRSGWLFFTEVPGRPDASRQMRFLRALPLLAPCVVMLALVAWHLGFLAPEIRATRAAHRHLTAKETESAAMRLSFSDDEAARAAVRADEVARGLLGGSDDLNAQLRHWRSAATDLGWDASFQPGDTTLEPPADDALLTYFSARGRLAPKPGNVEQLPSLLRLLDQFSASAQRMDLTRLAVRADDAGRYSLELNLRFAARVPHAKAP